MVCSWLDSMYCITHANVTAGIPCWSCTCVIWKTIMHSAVLHPTEHDLKRKWDVDACSAYQQADILQLPVIVRPGPMYQAMPLIMS